MGYTRHPDDKPPAPGTGTAEAIRRLSNRPEFIDLLDEFVDLFGIDGYDPLEKGGVGEIVRQIIIMVVADATHMAEEAALARPAS